MDQWDEEKLRDVALSKHGNPRTTTDVCPPRLIHVLYVTERCADCLQVLHRGHRESKVSASGRRTHIGLTFKFVFRFGWFWECPNGGEKCQYRHALPPGFVLKSQKKAAEEAAKANTISLEEFLEVEVRPAFARNQCLC